MYNANSLTCFVFANFPKVSDSGMVYYKKFNVEMSIISFFCIFLIFHFLQIFLTTDSYLTRFFPLKKNSHHRLVMPPLLSCQIRRLYVNYKKSSIIHKKIRDKFFTTFIVLQYVVSLILQSRMRQESFLGLIHYAACFFIML